MFEVNFLHKVLFNWPSYFLSDQPELPINWHQTVRTSRSDGGGGGGLGSGGGDRFIEAYVIDFLDEGVHERHRERSRTQKINEFPELKLNKCSTNGI